MSPMKMWPWWILVIASRLLADDLTTVSGKTYTNARVFSVEPDGITVMHEAGAAKVPFTDLPQEIQIKYGYDPQKALEYRNRAAEAQRKVAQAQAEIARAQAEQMKVAARIKEIERQKKTLNGKVVSNVGNGVLVRCTDCSGLGIVADSMAQIGGGGGVSGPGAYGSGSGGDASSSRRMMGEERGYVKKMGEYTTVGKTAKKEGPPPSVYGTFFLVGHPEQASLVDDADISVVAYPCGTYSYTAVNGAMKTVQRYSVSAATAASLAK